MGSLNRRATVVGAVAGLACLCLAGYVYVVVVYSGYFSNYDRRTGLEDVA